MILDGHIHIMHPEVDTADFAARLERAGIDGGVVLSLPPRPLDSGGREYTTDERLANLFDVTSGSADLFPFYWIDPVAPDAGDQVAAAEERGVLGYKVICSTHCPCDERAMPVYRRIARAGKPILFHSGILWDGIASSKYNRPAEFEGLLEVDGLRFALAHISWPWCDEHIAVYGKILNAYSRRSDLAVEMFVDLTPGTPPIYREEALTRLFRTGYDVEHNVLFGTDGCAENYHDDWARDWMTRDNAIYDRLGIGDGVRANIYSENLKRFVGRSDVKVVHSSPVAGE
jgi:predicted TIM-barrel fold metal-dependent hydrolase